MSDIYYQLPVEIWLQIIFFSDNINLLFVDKNFFGLIKLINDKKPIIKKIINQNYFDVLRYAIKNCIGIFGDNFMEDCLRQSFYDGQLYIADYLVDKGADIYSMGNLYFITTNETENHNNFRYVDGLNVLQGKFNKKTGFYVHKPETICQYLNHNIYLRDVYLPKGKTGFKKFKLENYYVANMIVLGKQRNLIDLDTWKYMIYHGTIITEGVIEYCRINKCTKIVDYLLDCLIETNHNIDIYTACKNGYTKLAIHYIKNSIICREIRYYIMSRGTYWTDNKSENINHEHIANLATQNGHIEILKYLVEEKYELVGNLYIIMFLACQYGHLEIIKYLVELGVDIRQGLDAFIYLLWQGSYFNILKYLLTVDSDIINIINKVDYNGWFKMYLKDPLSIDSNHYIHPYTISELKCRINSPICKPIYYLRNKSIGTIDFDDFNDIDGFND
ncbi:putative ankyrin repeat protein [Acanthamoeba castellanii mimivirus]|uniref:Putative ankyrin repeat protein L797 n=6 Tax=Mimivirus TaxID=315393 RepID=YR797_MIMIV|nr:putative ankyrin repeat protein [Acanthamoeba polyphaga mimivirus]Q5UQ38.1 RecName: Full=Putative ankyrin repeat protein L797 [Acanthamoeba polyphaga mimivirus]AEQ61012.1 ankyrin repeat-containing protein [Acanthamoeba castellanii mamavirus]AHA45031.1 putative ankyrin repeat protein [Hirudovirus strain Sangsue]AHJ40386.1 ankyrin repeat protein [Samba virus]ALR84445.1 ankyrin repeat-containing protein [Niemeyer virus]AMZ03239.1 putative ankyrin repeat protein [Mimivirus Bombay]EJN40557.1 h